MLRSGRWGLVCEILGSGSKRETTAKGNRDGRSGRAGEGSVDLGEALRKSEKRERKRNRNSKAGQVRG